MTRTYYGCVFSSYLEIETTKILCFCVYEINFCDILCFQMPRLVSMAITEMRCFYVIHFKYFSSISSTIFSKIVSCNLISANRVKRFFYFAVCRCASNFIIRVSRPICFALALENCNSGLPQLKWNFEQICKELVHIDLEPKFS